MSDNQILFICLGLYLVLLIFLGLLANKKRESNSLKDFYLAGGGLNTFVLLLTLYATQYSANTMLVTPAEVVSKGMGMILILGYMTAIVVVYLTFAPQLYQISKNQNFITPGDWFDYRFKSPKLTLAANIILVIVSVNFLLSQLMAMGHITSGLTGGEIPYWVGVVALALVVILYESLGGMRAVAWTDAMQGVMIFVGLIGVFWVVFPGMEGLEKISIWLLEHEPEKIGIPSTDFQIYWLSSILMIGIGGAVYPQVIQRIYAAKSVKSLKRSLGAMVFVPIVTVLILFLLGMISIPHFIENPALSNDSVLPEMLKIWGTQSSFAFAMMILVVIGLLAAIMSTADSVLLTLSSIVAKDIFGKSFLKGTPEETLTKSGKIFSWVTMFIMVLIALQPKITLWGLIELKMQVLIQIAPLFILGVHSHKIKSQAVLLGLILGALVSLGCFFFGFNILLGIHSGLLAFGLNILICLVGSRFISENKINPISP